MTSFVLRLRYVMSSCMRLGAMLALLGLLISVGYGVDRAMEGIRELKNFEKDFTLNGIPFVPTPHWKFGMQRFFDGWGWYLAWCGAAFLLWRLRRVVPRLVFPLPKAAQCPDCGYHIGDPPMRVCPECGVRLDEADHSPGM